MAAGPVGNRRPRVRPRDSLLRLLHQLPAGRPGRRHHDYFDDPPIIRPVATGSRTVTWAEFVEAGLLRGYRNRRVPMAELRTFIDLLRQEYGASCSWKY